MDGMSRESPTERTLMEKDRFCSIASSLYDVPITLQKKAREIIGYKLSQIADN